MKTINKDLSTYEYATMRQRAYAWILDITISGIVMLVFVVAVSIAYVSVTRPDWYSPDNIFVSIASSLASFALAATMVVMVMKRGQFVGKILIGIVTVDAEGNFPNLRQTLIREVGFKVLPITIVSQAINLLVSLGVLEDHDLGGRCAILVAVAAYYLGILLWIAVDRKNQTLHDKVAKTYVVQMPEPTGLNDEVSELDNVGVAVGVERGGDEDRSENSRA